MTQVFSQCLADVVGDGQAIAATAFPANANFSCIPVNVIQPHSGDLAATQTQSRQD
jgi:hypothetical protein